MISVTAAIQQIAACRTTWGKTSVPITEAAGKVITELAPNDNPSTSLAAPGTFLTSRHLATMAQSGIMRVSVYAPPSVAFIGVGENECAINRLTVEGSLANYRIPLRDSATASAGSPGMQKLLEASLDADLLVLCGDISPKIFIDAGVEQVFNKVKAHPCQAFWFGYSLTKTRVMLMPSNPFAVQVSAKLFLESYIRACWNMRPIRPLMLPYAEHRSPAVGQDEYVPAAMVHRNGLKVRAISFSGKTDIREAAQAEGFLCHESGHGSLEPSSLVPFYPWNDLA
ncbi:molybdopterin-binding domain-containing protein [Chitinophaga rhizosphaerae]|uniref:hypothetical protein n=1 Tax=Chitinophaga rhizosphaerae TaxID=1864947 RepID=UPI000F803E6C|nr:hypothetical protein [Chitinophaga rhizosphaerae]